MMYLCVLALAALTVAAPPTPWSTNVSIFVDEKLPASQFTEHGKPTTVMVPELTSDLQIELNNHKEVGFQLCLKQTAAAPAVAGTQNFDNPLYCELFHFTNGTKVDASRVYRAGAAAARQRSVSSQLRGFGSALSASAASASASLHAGHSLARRGVSAGEGYVQMKNVRGGAYYLTVAATSKLTANITLSMTLSGMRCPTAGENGAANCAPFGTIALHQSENVAALAPKAVAVRALSGWQAIGANTGNLQISANLYDAPNATANILARWGAPPTMDEHDAMFALTDAGTGKGETKMATIAAPTRAMWYVAVFNGNHTVANVNLTVTLYQCDKDKFGPECKTAPTMLTKAGDLKSMEDAKKDVPLYFAYHANSTAELRALLANASAEAVAVAAAALNPDDKRPELFARLGALPTADTFDLFDCSVSHCPADQSTLIVPADDVADASAPWYVMVVPQSDGGVGVWNAAGGACAGNCGGQGNCTAATATCTCDADYTSFDCALSKSKLERWEWALIIGGGVLVAIGLIGCIVFFIQKQQRRAGFERV